MSKNKTFFLTAMGFGLLMSFQNCSRISFQNINELYSSPQKSQNNGEGYSGKPEGNFYRFIPEFTCEQNEAPVAHINIKGNSISLIENKKLLCGAISQQLDNGLIDRSIYQQEIVGYQEGIFEGVANTPNSIPANLVEVWCKDSTDEKGIETITHFNHLTNSAVNRIYYSKNGVQTQIPDFSVARVIANKTVLIKDEKDFQLTVHRDQPSLQMGLFNAHLEAVIEGQKITRETYCRLGGSLDPKIWPAKQIVDFNVGMLKVAPNLNSVGYTSTTATGIPHLYATNTDGTNHVQASPNLPISGIAQFLFSLDSKSLIYAGDARLPGVRELFKVNTDASSLIQLSTPLDNANQGVSGTESLKLSQDGQAVIFGDASFSPSASAFSHTWLQSVSITGGQAPQSLTPSPSLSLLGAKSAAVSKNKVVFFCCDTAAELYSANLDGSGLTKITPPHSTDWTFGWLTPVFAAGDYAYTLASDITTGQLRGYIVALDGSDSLELPPGSVVDEEVLSENYALISQAPCTDDSCARQLLNLRTKTMTTLPALKSTRYVDSSFSTRIFFTKGATALIGPKVLSDGRLQAVSISTAAGDVKDLCPGVTSQQMLIKEMGQNEFLILTYDHNRQILNAYLNSQDSGCEKVNSTVATNPKMDFLKEAFPSPDNQKIIVKLSAVGFNPYPLDPAPLKPKPNQLLYLPLNGTPSFVVDTPTYEEATISEALFLNDSRTVLFVGDQIRPADKNIFLWAAPP